MWFCTWSWFWIMPLLMLVMIVACLLLMFRGSHRGGCCFSGQRYSQRQSGEDSKAAAFSAENP